MDVFKKYFSLEFREKLQAPTSTRSKINQMKQYKDMKHRKKKYDLARNKKFLLLP